MAGVVYNNCYGGFSLSLEAQKIYLELKGHKPIFNNSKVSWEKRWYAEGVDFYDRDIPRHDPDLVKVVQALGRKADGDCARLEVEPANPGDLYRIDEYDGMEQVIFNYDQTWKVVG